jgi:hypothetical protein
MQTAIGRSETELGNFLVSEIDRLANTDTAPPKIYRMSEEDVDIINHIKTRPIFERPNALNTYCIHKIQNEMTAANYRTPEIAKCIMTYLKEYLLTYHPDKKDIAKSHLKRVFNTDSDETLDTLLHNENGLYRDKIITFAKKLRALYGENAQQQTGGANLDDDMNHGENSVASSMNKTLLKEIVRWILLYLDCATEIDDGKGMVFLPNFVDILATDDTPRQAKKYILNAQILILYCFYYNGTNKSALVHIKNHRINSKKFPEHFSVHLFQKDEAVVPEWLNGSFPDKADGSIKAASEIIINAMLPNRVLYNGSGKKLDIHNLLFANESRRFIINNAAPLVDNVLTNVSKDELRRRVYCPATSIADAMSYCTYKDAEKQKNAAIYPMNMYIENENGPKYIYSIQVYASKKTNATHKLTIDGVVTVEGNPVTIRINKALDIAKLGDQDLSAVMAYHNMVLQMVQLFSDQSINTIVGPTTQQQKLNGMDKFKYFVRGMAKEIIQYCCIKSIGDWGQEIASVAKFGAYAGTDLSKINQIMEYSNTVPYNTTGQAIRLGIAGDRPSAFRMIYMNIFANPNSKNNQAVVGYVSTTNTSNYIVYNPYAFESKPLTVKPKTPDPEYTKSDKVKTKTKTKAYKVKRDVKITKKFKTKK